MAVVACAVVAHVGRIENRLEVVYDGGVVTASSAGRSARLEVGERRFAGVAFEGHRSMMSETVLCRLAVQPAGGEELVVVDGWTVHLLGRPRAGTCLRSSHPWFDPSFGDWTMDFRSGTPVTVAGLGELRAPFTLLLRTVGRGTTVLRLEGEPVVRAIIRDGYLDNDLGLELEHSHGVGTDRPVPPWENVRRIAGQAAEIGLLAALVVLAAVLLPRAGADREATSGGRHWWVPVAVAGLAVTHAALCLVFARDVLGGVPHIPDSAYYLRQARAIAATGSTTLALPFDGDVAEAVAPPLTQVAPGEVRLGYYERGWALLLAAFASLDRPHLLNPLLSAVALGLLAALARRLFDDGVAMVCAVLWAASPFTIIMAGDQMNHTATACLLLAALLAAAGTHSGWLLLSGVLLGVAAWVRLLTTLVLAVPAAAVVQALRAGRRWTAGQVAALVLGGGVMAVVILLDNAGTTGNPLRFPRQVYHGLSLGIENLAAGMENADSTLAGLPPILWGGAVPHLLAALALAGAILAPWRRGLPLAAAPLAVVAAYAFTNAGGLHGYGPRFYFEAVPFLFLLAALGATALARGRDTIGRRAALVAGGALLAANVHALATVLPRYEDYNLLREAPARAVAALPRGSWLLVDANSWEQYDELAAVFDPTFEDLVVVREAPGITAERLALLRPDWAIYRGAANRVEVVRTARGGMRARPPA